MSSVQYVEACDRRFKICTDINSQSVRLMPATTQEQLAADEFKVMFQDFKPLGDTYKVGFTSCRSVGEVKAWLTAPAPNGLGGQLVSYPPSELPAKGRRRKQSKTLFPSIEPFVQSKDSSLDYSERFNVFRSLCFETCKNLVAMQSTGVNVPKQTAGMIFPQTRNGSVRVSEQESRFQFCSVATNRVNTIWAVEVPTSRRYKQKKDGTTWMSGRTDVALFDFSTRWQRTLNIEFKAGRADVASFAKDLEQLVREQIPAAWFHLLGAKANLDFVVSNMRQGFRTAIRVPLNLPPELESEEIFRVDIDLALCVLKGITTGSGVSTGADLYLKRIEYRRPNPEQFNLPDFDRFIDDELKNPEQWERESFDPKASPVGEAR